MCISAPDSLTPEELQGIAERELLRRRRIIETLKGRPLAEAHKQEIAKGMQAMSPEAKELRKKRISKTFARKRAEKRARQAVTADALQE